MFKVILPLAFLGVSAVAAMAGEAAPVAVRGTDGLVAVPFEVDNATGGAITCGAAIAHWYSAPVGSAAPGAAVSATLWSNPATGEVFLLNALEDRMPILSLWCGQTGSDVSTGHPIRLARRAGAAEPAVRLVCRPAREKALDCGPVAGP